VDDVRDMPALGKGINFWLSSEDGGVAISLSPQTTPDTLGFF
jgi:hypothetical protein